ncbi:MAG: recombinase family protein [Treponema sp.]|nr:recombinase family protein [Treponema sp.]
MEFCKRLIIEEIKNKSIDKIWVWENSRLSRNEITSFHLNRIFKENNVLLYIKDAIYDLNNPQNELIHGIFSQFAQYERHNIVERTKRGLHAAMNNGIRGYSWLLGYKKEAEHFGFS